jgi:alkylated DNA repair protein (DNA oxidative demethylase)
MPDLFPAAGDEALDPGAFLFRGFAAPQEASLINEVAAVTAAAGFRHLVTPGGGAMSVAMTNCGRVGWVSDRRGYRYEAADPQTGKLWPAMPAAFVALAERAAARAGFAGFAPDACLVNLYLPGTKMGLHIDHDERDFSAPIVSVSLGLPAVFLWGGPKRTDRPRKVALYSGDVVVWGGPARRFYHGVAPLKTGTHDALGARRINLTFRCAL